MIIYYIEVNLICMIILLLFRAQLKNLKNASSDQRVLALMIWGTVVFCVSDMIAGVFRGQQWTGARIIIESSNLMYFEMLAWISFLWGLYVDARLTKSYRYNRKQLLLKAMPLIVFTLIALSNPLTHVLFRINAENLYERNIGVYFHWVIVWTYFLIPSVKTLRAYMKQTSQLKRQEIVPMIYFTIAPLIASIIQMIFYGVTSTQVGITVAIVLICIKSQDTQILTDALTGINNRRGFDYYLEECIQRHTGAVYTLIMMDVDSFKHINDKYGHMIGDMVLKTIADDLKQACKVTSKRLHLCRFGGDEFVILGIDYSEIEIAALKKAIEAQVGENARYHNLPCMISVSVGAATGKCENENDLKELLNKADQAMYENKQKKKHVRGIKQR